MSEIGEQKWVEIRASMIETPFTFFEVEEEAIWADAAQFEEAEFGETPEALDAIDMVLAPGEFVFVVMDAVMLVALQDQPVIGPPAVSVDVAAFQDFSFDDRQKLSGRAVFHDADVDVVATFV